MLQSDEKEVNNENNVRVTGSMKATFDIRSQFR